MDTKDRKEETSSEVSATNSSVLDNSLDASVSSSSFDNTTDATTGSSRLEDSASASFSESDTPTALNVSELPQTDVEEDESLAGLLTYMKSKLHIKDTPHKKDKQKGVLKSLDVEGVVEYIKSGRCKNIVTMAGAGISTSAGIPDFRSPGSGLYSNLQKYNLPHPEAIFELDFFCQNPKPFFTLAKELYPGTFNPTPCHYFVRLLKEKGLLLRHYTQNIDTLEHVAGLEEDKLVEAHGSFRTAHCLHCNKLHSQEWIKQEIFDDRIPTCESCSGVVKPDIVFFGEGLPKLFFNRIASDFPKCDLLIIMGTSLSVQPFASLVDEVKPNCPRFLINREAVGTDSMMSMLQRLVSPGKKKGLQMNDADNNRDVALLGDCDEGCNKMVDLLGWREEFDKLVEDHTVILSAKDKS